MAEKRDLRAAAVVGLVWALMLSGGGWMLVFGTMSMVIWSLRHLSFRPLELLPFLLLPLPLWWAGLRWIGAPLIARLPGPGLAGGLLAAALGIVAPPLGLAAFISVVELASEGSVRTTLSIAADSTGFWVLLLATQPGGLCAAIVMYSMLKSPPAPAPA